MKNLLLPIKPLRLGKLKAIYEDQLIRFYKCIINPNAHKLEKMHLSEDEKYALHFRNFNPNLLNLYDDCQSEIKALIKLGKKKNTEVIKDVFFKGRHIKSTNFFCLQDDSNLDSDLRKNAHMNVFTNEQVANAWFGRAANNFSLIERKKAEKIASIIFDEKTTPKHTKLIYSRLDKYPFQYILADEYGDDETAMCSGPAQKYCEKIKARDDVLDKSNAFYKSFADQV